MKKKASPLTLANISKLIDKKLLSIHHQLNNLLGETTYTRNEVNGLRAEMNSRFEEVNSKFVEVNTKMKQGFDDVDDKLQNLLNEMDEMTDRKFGKRIKNLENRVYA